VNVSVQPSKISGTVHAPASKSAMQRACAAALIRNGETIIHNPGNSNDDKAALDVVQQLGATVTVDGPRLIITSKGVNPVSAYLNCGESGLGIRMFTPLAALSSKEISITGSGSLVTRPMDFFDKVLPQLGITTKSNNGKLPLLIKGPLQPRNIEVDGSLSSQFLTGLLMAYAAANATGVSIKVKDLKSKPYIDLTLELMQEFGLKVPVNRDYKEFSFGSDPVNRQSSTVNYAVEGDWSGGAFLLVAGAIAGSVIVEGLSNSSRQADKKIIAALVATGADVKIGNGTIEVRQKKLQPFEFDATDCPDLFPPLVALAANCGGTSKIAGLQRLKYKESDRGATLREEFEKLDTRIELNGDEMLVHGHERVRVKNHVLSSHHDHRIAMACAVACLNGDAEVTLRNADAVKKSYPDFWDHLKALNAVLSLKPITTDNTFRL
jgi:3-phosphoshikimate 1-carboxyvinyltransferase